MMRRRDFLAGLGLGGAGLGVGGLWMPGARASATPAPKRLLIISHCHGTPYDSWKMRPEGLAEDQEWEVDLAAMTPEEFSPILAPLYEHRSRMLCLDGLSLATAELDLDGYRHEKGWVHSWTGDWAFLTASDEIWAQSPSLDQLVAAEIARSDRLPSLEMDLAFGGGESGRAVSFSGVGTPLPLLDSPARVWQRLFGPSVNPDPLGARQGSALDFAQAEYAQLAPKLDPEDRNKLDLHFDLLRSLGDRLEGMANLSCDTTPDVPADPLSYDQAFDAFADLIAVAFSCDITRVATLSLGDIPTVEFGWDSVTDDVHKGLAHEIYNDTQAHEAMTDYSIMHAAQVARLVSLLSSIPEGNGSVMDNTLIVWGSELANGWHGYQNYCPVLIGGSWHFRSGRYLHWPHETPIELLVPATVSTGGYSEVSGKPHQHMLVSIAQAMGVDTERVGIDHVQGQTGIRVECTGPLPNLV